MRIGCWMEWAQEMRLTQALIVSLYSTKAINDLTWCLIWIAVAMVVVEIGKPFLQALAQELLTI